MCENVESDLTNERRLELTDFQHALKWLTTISRMWRERQLACKLSYVSLKWSWTARANGATVLTSVVQSAPFQQKCWASSPMDSVVH